MERSGAFRNATRIAIAGRADVLGSGDEAVELFHMLNPINHTRTLTDVARLQDGAVRRRW